MDCDDVISDVELTGSESESLPSKKTRGKNDKIKKHLAALKKNPVKEPEFFRIDDLQPRRGYKVLDCDIKSTKFGERVVLSLETGVDTKRLLSMSQGFTNDLEKVIFHVFFNKFRNKYLSSGH